MKKALSLIMAVVMIVACVPFASAYEFSEPASAFMNAYCRYFGDYYSIYTKDGVTGEVGFSLTKIEEIYSDAEAEDLYNAFDFDLGIRYYAENEPEKLEEMAECFGNLSAQVEQWLAENGYVRAIDAFYLGYADMVGAYYDYDTLDLFIEFIDEKTDVEKAEQYVDELYEAYSLLEKAVAEGLDKVTQEEVDSKAKSLAEFYIEAMDCFEGRHDFDEYADLGNGSHKAECSFCTVGEVIEEHTFGQHIPDDNGTTATAKCDKCDATDIIEVEWEDLPAEDDSNFFTALMATLRDFFAKLAEFFQNIFG